jgi:putative thioredoxin
MTDVTDVSFEQEVLARSEEVPVVVDLWAPWCGPCRSLGPIIEKVVAETDGAVELAKVNIDENPQIAAAFQVQSIPAVFALREKKVVDGFVGAIPESQVRAFVERLAPARSEADELVAAGDEDSLRRALELQPDHVGAIVALAELLVRRGDDLEEALALLQRVPETAETRRVAALARLAAAGLNGPARPDEGDDSLASRLDDLLARVKQDEQARQEYLDLLETMDSDDPERSRYRRALASQLF